MDLVIATWVLVGVTICAIIYQVRETKRSRSAEALAFYRELWESDRMRARRRRLASALLDDMTVETIPDAVTEDVLNFFEDLATAYKEKYLSLSTPSIRCFKRMPSTTGSRSGALMRVNCAMTRRLHRNTETIR
jgi:hypothetical protein